MGLLRSSTKDVPPTPPEKATESPPPGYGDANGSEPDVTAGFAKLNLDNGADTPSVDECIAHLKFLEALNQLREDIATQDGLYGIYDSLVPADTSDQTKSQYLAKIREKRWAVFVTIAVKRFEAYFQTLEPGSHMTTIDEMKSATYTRILASGGGKHAWTVDNLPPLGKLHAISIQMNAD